jgi:hypothetical protein
MSLDKIRRTLAQVREMLSACPGPPQREPLMAEWERAVAVLNVMAHCTVGSPTGVAASELAARIRAAEPTERDRLAAEFLDAARAGEFDPERSIIALPNDGRNDDKPGLRGQVLIYDPDEA